MEPTGEPFGITPQDIIGSLPIAAGPEIHGKAVRLQQPQFAHDGCRLRVWENFSEKPLPGPCTVRKAFLSFLHT